MVSSRLAWVATLCSACLLAVTAAPAKRVAIDNSDHPITPCTIGTSCVAETLPFSVNFGFGSFSSLYIYDNGLISIGSEIAAGADLTSLATIGGNVLTAGYSSEMTLANFVIQDPTASANFDFPGVPVFRYRYTASFDAIVDMPMEVSIFDLGSSQFALLFSHGALFDPDDPDIAEDAYLGYDFSSGAFQAGPPTLEPIVNSESQDFLFFFPGRVGTVPEPATWLTMIGGLALAGGVMRRRRAALPA